MTKFKVGDFVEFYATCDGKYMDGFLEKISLGFNNEKIYKDIYFATVLCENGRWGKIKVSELKLSTKNKFAPFAH